MQNTAWAIVFALLMSACSGSEKNESSNKLAGEATFSDAPTRVRVKPVKQEVFHFELVSNGRVQAGRKVDLKFQSTEIIEQIYVRNGQKVTKGSKLASLETIRLENALLIAEDNYERAKLDLQDILIGQGFVLSEQDSIPESILRIAKVKSNFQQNQINADNARYNLASATLVAPFDGVVANMNQQACNYPATSEPFCTILDLDHPEVRFMILENERSMVRVGETVLIAPFSNSEELSTGVVSEMNPMVDKNGMIEVKAVMNNPKQMFYEGMNVRVRVQRAVEQALIIPKSALLLRNNRKVVFVAKENSAQWVYVQTGLENSESFTVTEGLQEGDSVIYEGNFNLAHEAPILVVE